MENLLRTTNLRKKVIAMASDWNWKLISRTKMWKRQIMLVQNASKFLITRWNSTDISDWNTKKLCRYLHILIQCNLNLLKHLECHFILKSKIFVQKSACSKEIVVFCKYMQWMTVSQTLHWAWFYRIKCVKIEVISGWVIQS